MSSNYPAGVTDADFEEPKMTKWEHCEVPDGVTPYCVECENSGDTNEDEVCEKCFEPEQIEHDPDFYEEE